MKRITMQAPSLRTISWTGNKLVDWACAGEVYLPDSPQIKLGQYHFAYKIDSAITSPCGNYTVLYEKLGTKGLLLKQGQFIREINRSYYYADAYEYPIAFMLGPDDRTYLIHCPAQYCRLDFEEVETGEIVTNHPDRKPSDFFHSRLEVSPDNSTFLSKGWAWHPYDYVYAFDIADCFTNPLLLDKSNLVPDSDGEICAASYIDNHLVLLGSQKETEPFNDEPSDCLRNGCIGIWDLRTNTITGIIEAQFPISAHLLAIDAQYAWNLYDHPRIINYRSGEVVAQIEEIATGQQVSSIIWHFSDLPTVAFHPQTKQVAIAYGKKIELLSH